MKITDKEIKKAIEDSGGIMSRILKALNKGKSDEDKISRTGLWQRINRNAELKEAVTNAEEDVLDETEDQLNLAVRKGEKWAVITMLRFKGSKRGYVQRQEVTGKDGEALIPPMPSGNYADWLLEKTKQDALKARDNRLKPSSSDNREKPRV